VENWPEFRPGTLLKRLVAHGVDFVVVGGIAMVGHGSARITNDLDICYATDSANLEALGAALVELGATLRGVSDDVPFVPDARTLIRTSILTLTSPDGPIDLLVGPAGAPAYQLLRARAERITLDGVGLLIASLDDLEAMKRTSGRSKDRLDLEEIEAIRRLRAREARPLLPRAPRP
jgi:predicted nucleotidyltransferase